MAIADLTIGDFQERFKRNFPFLPYYQENKSYKKGQLVYDKTADVFYNSLIDGNEQPLSDNTAWKVNEDENAVDYVSDEDIENAWSEALEVANEDILTDLMFLYLVAFYLSYDLNLAESGASGTGSFPVTQRTVGSVSESYGLPKWVLEDPILSFYAKNGFGLKYLSMLLPKLVGNIAAIGGWTQP